MNPQNSQQNRPRYRSRSIRRYRIDSEHELVCIEGTGSVHLLPTHVAKILDSCRSLQNLDEHARQICLRLGYAPERFSELNRVLSDLAESGLLLSDISIVSSYSRLPPDSGSLSDISSLGIVTSQRPKCLARCLSTFATQTNDCGRQISFHVVDDTSDKDIREQNWRELLEIRKRLGVQIFYTGIEQKLQFAQYLQANGLDPEVVRFALFNPLQAALPTGANRNAFLLSTLGELTLSVDDDTVCCMSSCANSEPALALTSRFVPPSLRFYPDRDTLLNAVASEDVDFVGTHAKVLGRKLCDVIREFATIVDVEQSDISDEFMRILEKRSGQVLLTQNGSLGDCGFSSPTWYLTAQGSTRKRLLESEYVYRSALTSRDVLNVADNYTLTDSPFFMTFAVGMDNRTGLVPFFPVQRNAEGTFSMVVRQCFSDSLTCHIPYAVAHYPPNHRSFDVDAVWRNASQVRMSDLLLLCIGSFRFDVPVPDASMRLRKLGNYLIELGSLGNSEFWSLMRQICFPFFARKISVMEDFCQKEKAAPAFWFKDVARSLEGQRQMLMKESFPTPEDLPSSGVEPEARKLAKKMICEYGKLLSAWPDIVMTTQNLRNDGKRLGVPVPVITSST